MSAFEDQARALGFLRPAKYAHIERERRWLCQPPPADLVARSDRITDRYLNTSRIRLREMIGDDGRVERKLTKKGDLAPDRRIITTIYLDEAEYALFAALPGKTLTKTRRHLTLPGVSASVDLFEGALAGLTLAEAEFPDDEAMAAWIPPDWFGREVTEDERYSGGWLIQNGLPD